MSKFLPNMGLSYDDVLLRPCYSEILPHQAELSTRFTRKIPLKIPLVSAAMDTVTESKVAQIMAQNGGIGVLHKNLPPDLQASEVIKVKKYETGIIHDPITIHPEQSLHEVKELTLKYNITGLPVVDQSKKLVGIITQRDMRFEQNLNQRVRDIMTPAEKLITAPTSTSIEQAKQLLHKHRIEKLPIVDEKGQLKGLITIRDIKSMINFPHANKDELGRLRVAAAIGVGENEFFRAKQLIEAQIDALVIDTAHGHSRGVIEMIKAIKSQCKVEVVAGNVATVAACQDLIKAGADAVKVGIGPGSICTTRVIAGIGVPQFSAVWECAQICTESDTPLIADGGIKYSGDIVKALAAGASSIMAGSLFAGTDETPGEMVLYKGRTYKVYRGMGSIGAMKEGSKDRYGQGDVKEAEKLVPEGVEGQLPYRGPLSKTIYQLVGGIRSGMGYVGAKNLEELRKKAEFIQISSASLRENHPHDIKITKEAPNYQLA